MTDKLVLLLRGYDPYQSHIVRGVLESHDIPVFIMDEMHNALAWNMQFALGGTRIMVLSTDYARALEILEDHVEPQTLPREEVSVLKRILQLVIFLFTGIPSAVRRKFK